MKARPYGVVCGECSPELRKKFASETARQRWIEQHRATAHKGRRLDSLPRLQKWEQGALEL